MTDTDTEHDAASRDDARALPGTSDPSIDRGRWQQPAPIGRRRSARNSRTASGDKTKRQAPTKRPSEETRKKRRPLIVTIGVGVVVLLVASGLYYWIENPQSRKHRRRLHRWPRRSTSRRRSRARCVSLDVTDNQFVKKGQPLIHIDPRQYVSDRDQAEGALATRKGAVRGPAARRRDRAQEFSGAARAGPGAARDRQGQSRQGAGRLRPPAEPAQTGDLAAGGRCRHRRAAAGAGAGRCWPTPRWRRIRRCRSGSARPTPRSAS